MLKHYILKDGRITEVSLREWAEWSETGDRYVDHTVIRCDDGTPEVLVSTIFVGIDLGFLPGGPPVLFETMIFGGHLDQYQVRYETMGEAKVGHWDAVDKAREAESSTKKEGR